MAGAPDVKMKNVFLGLGDDEAKRIETLHERGEFFWLDLDLDSAGAERLGELLGMPEHVLSVLRNFSSSSIFGRSYLDEAQIVFPFACIGDPEAPPLDSEGLKPCDVQVLVHGDHIVTVHHGACEPLRELAADPYRVTRSEQHFVYTVLERMVATVFDSLRQLGAEAERIEDEFTESHTGRRNLEFIRVGRSRLNRLRGHLSSRLAVFEQVADEIPDVKDLGGDKDYYFANARDQLKYAVNSVDASIDALGGLLDLGINRMTSLFTVIATIFLPLTFLAGFFGQNFDYLAQHIASTASFWLLGIGLLVLSALGSVLAIRRQLGPRAPDPSRSS